MCETQNAFLRVIVPHCWYSVLLREIIHLGNAYMTPQIVVLANEKTTQTAVRSSRLGGQNLDHVSCKHQIGGEDRSLLFRTETNKSSPEEPLRNPEQEHDYGCGRV